MTATFLVYDPTVPRRRAYAPLAERRPLSTVGLLWNGKPNGDVYLGEIRRLLADERPDVRFVERTKSLAARAVDAATLADLAGCGAVVNALGD